MHRSTWWQVYMRPALCAVVDVPHVRSGMQEEYVGDRAAGAETGTGVMDRVGTCLYLLKRSTLKELTCVCVSITAVPKSPDERTQA